MRFDERVITDAPPAAAFSFVSELANVTAWDPSITHVEKVTPGPVGVGTFYRVTMHMFGVTTTMDYHVEVHEPDRRVIFMGRGTTATVTDTVLVVPYRDGSRVRWTADIHFIPPLMLLDPVFSWFFSANVRTATSNLKHMLNRLAPTDHFLRGAPRGAEQALQQEQDDREQGGMDPQESRGEQRQEDEGIVHH